jgi:hypothetical protein
MSQSDWVTEEQHALCVKPRTWVKSVPFLAEAGLPDAECQSRGRLHLPGYQ